MTLFRCEVTETPRPITFETRSLSNFIVDLIIFSFRVLSGKVRGWISRGVVLV